MKKMEFFKLTCEQKLIDEANKHKDRWGVHESHCCPKHGCKYGDADCPVVLGLTDKHKENCEDCEREIENPRPLDLLEAWSEFYDCGGNMSPAVSDKDIGECSNHDLLCGMIKMIRERPRVVVELGKKQGWWPWE